MTTIDKLPDYNGEHVSKTAIKFVGVGTGFDGLDIRPIVMELDDEAYFVVHVSAAESASHKRDKHGDLLRLQRVRAENMAPIDQETARKALREYAAEIERIKAEIDGQLMLDAEAEAEAREELDGTGTPAEVAHAAAARVKG